MKKIILFLVCAPLIVGCGAWSNLTNGTGIPCGPFELPLHERNSQP